MTWRVPQCKKLLGKIEVRFLALTTSSLIPSFSSWAQRKSAWPSNRGSAVGSEAVSGFLSWQRLCGVIFFLYSIVERIDVHFAWYTCHVPSIQYDATMKKCLVLPSSSPPTSHLVSSCSLMTIALQLLFLLDILRAILLRCSVWLHARMICSSWVSRKRMKNVVWCFYLRVLQLDCFWLKILMINE